MLARSQIQYDVNYWPMALQRGMIGYGHHVAEVVMFTCGVFWLQTDVETSHCVY